MRSYRKGINGNPARGPRGHRTGLRVAVMAPLIVLAMAACDWGSLLDVDLPGNVTADALDDPALAETLVLSAEGDFECGFVDHWYPGQWFEEFQNVGTGRPNALAGLRSALLGVYADPCDSGTGPIWTTIQVPRQQAKRAIELINSFPEGSVGDKDFLIAKARLYEGYSIQLLGESFCGVTLDGGPELTPEQAYAEAESRFTEAINLGSGVTGSRAGEAADVVSAAYVGRARARLLQGNNPTGVVSDAQAVPAGFEKLATYDTQPGRRRNRIYERNNAGDDMMPWRDYTDLTIAADGSLTVASGMPDPRVPVEVTDDPDPRGFTFYRVQHKFNGYDSDIPFATWREAQLMIAEVQQGSQAITIINNLRTDAGGLPGELDSSAWPLPTYSSNPADIETAVREERRRELWMQGVQAGDKVRWGYPAWGDTDEYGQQLGPGTCLQIPYLEVTSNTNL